MDNAWFIDDCEPYVSWTACLKALAHEPRELLSWTQEVIRLGVATRVLLPVSIPEYGARGPNAPDRLIDALADRFRSGTIDLFSFADLERRCSENMIHTRVAIADRDGRIREFMAGRVSDLPRSIWHNADGEPDVYDKGFFFLDVSGQIIRVGHPVVAPAVTFALRTNIWYPWIPGDGVGQSLYDFDNRPLANTHTPGLNLFLSEVKSVTEQRGGAWQFESLAYGPMNRETGIDLEWVPSLPH